MLVKACSRGWLSIQDKMSAMPYAASCMAQHVVRSFSGFVPVKRRQHVCFGCSCIRYMKELGLKDVEMINLDLHKGETKTADYLQVKVSCMGILPQ